MHRSVLQNKGYMKFSNSNVIEVISMEELERALQNNHWAIKTYDFKDPYGDVLKYLVEFPGVTLDDLDRLSNGKPIEYMEGGRIPYTAVVDPHTEKLMEGIKGERNGKQLIEAIKPHLQTLRTKHGPGVSRKLWNQVRAAEPKCDVLLAQGELNKAVKLYTGLRAQATEEPEAIRPRLAALKSAIATELTARLDKAGKTKKDAAKKREVKRLAGLARRLGDKEVEKRAAALLTDSNK